MISFNYIVFDMFRTTKVFIIRKSVQTALRHFFICYYIYIILDSFNEIRCISYNEN